MMEVMKGWIRYKQEYSCWAPWKIVTTMTLCAYHHLPCLPEKESEAMASASQEDKGG